MGSGDIFFLTTGRNSKFTMLCEDINYMHMTCTNEQFYELDYRQLVRTRINNNPPPNISYCPYIVILGEFLQIPVAHLEKLRGLEATPAFGRCCRDGEGAPPTGSKHNRERATDGSVEWVEMLRTQQIQGAANAAEENSTYSRVQSACRTRGRQQCGMGGDV